MKIHAEQVLLRIDLRNTDKFRGLSAADQLVDSAHRARLAGATMVRGFFGLGAAGELLESSPWDLVEHVPVVIELFDVPRIISLFLPCVQEIAAEGLITLMLPDVHLHRRSPCAVVTNVEHEDVGSHPDDLSALRIGEAGQLLRVFIAESDTFGGEPLYRVMVRRAQELELSRAAVFRGVMGFGVSRCLHTATLWRRSRLLPVVVEIVDRPRGIQSLLPFLDEAAGSGMAMVENLWLRGF